MPASMPGSICCRPIVDERRNCGFGIGGCIARLTQALVSGETTVYAALDEVLGVPDTRISLPPLLAAAAAETAALRHSAEVLRQAVAQALSTQALARQARQVRLARFWPKLVACNFRRSNASSSIPR
ncbi:MAG TPA: hypothetical protein PKB14_19065 [Rubrivivax sp.]|nr:hypothetical protein [Rubrivivax sp.]